MNRTISEFLSGKKTILVGCLLAAAGILQQDSQMILEGLGFIFVRLGIKKVEAKK